MKPQPVKRRAMAAMQKFETKFMINEGEPCVVLANKAPPTLEFGF